MINKPNFFGTLVFFIIKKSFKSKYNRNVNSVYINRMHSKLNMDKYTKKYLKGRPSKQSRRIKYYQ